MDSCRERFACVPVPLAPGWCWGCICFWVSALSPPQLWHSSSAEPQPQSVLCHCIPMSPLCLALLFSAILDWLWEPWIFLGLYQLPRAGLVCPQQRRRGWGDGRRALCRGRAPPLHSPCPALAGPSHLWDPRRGRWWRRGRSVPWQLRVPCHSAGHSLIQFLPAGVWWLLGGVLTGQSRLCVRDAPGWQ